VILKSEQAEARSLFSFIHKMEKKILMVCLGNICRSPIAEGVMQSKFQKYRIEGSVDSAGVLSYHAGQPPDERAIKISGSYHVDISRQKARKILPSDFDKYDFIFAMDRSVYNSISAVAISGEHAKKIHLFLEYAGNVPGSEVPDPYYSSLDAFDRVFKLVDAACESIIRKWYPHIQS
jgi:protein-tyrosine phosphatase